jgi:hypothetical protein
VESDELEILQEPAVVLARLKVHAYHPELHVPATTAPGTGRRRGELLALPWTLVDPDKATAKVERSLEETKDGLRVKSPKKSPACAPSRCRRASWPFCASTARTSSCSGWR